MENNLPKDQLNVEQAIEQFNAQMPEIDPKLRRLAYVQEWSDELIRHMLASCKTRGVDGSGVLEVAQKAADNLNLNVLREGDPALALAAAEALGFESAAALDDFNRKYPALSSRMGAQPILAACQGQVVALSLTEIVFEAEEGTKYAVEKAKFPEGSVSVGDQVAVERYGSVRKLPKARLFVGCWSHTWSWCEDGRVEAHSRIVVDVANDKLVAAQVSGYKTWNDATSDQKDDLARSLFDENKVSSDPQAFDFVEIDRLPKWAATAMHGQQLEPYRDGEVLGLDRDGHVIEWNAGADMPVETGQSLVEFGLQNLREHELARVGVTREVWEAAMARGGLSERTVGMTDKDVVDGAERMARVLLQSIGFEFTGEAVRNSSNPRAVSAWNIVSKMLEEYNGTDLASAVDSCDEDEGGEPEALDTDGRYTNEQVVALGHLSAALALATDTGLFDELVADCNIPGSINDLCDAVQDEVKRLSGEVATTPDLPSPRM
ncbi:MULTISPECIES: hypothetical protein [unclassified Burkholderia]|uniref:hypothetical protein n=1 Tax=unclassified Burkholderia TaxID=2613784 RepID=UPI002AB0D1FC|nr:MULTISPECIES: hypothetical protein [unclassified Burkholderia]